MIDVIFRWCVWILLLLADVLGISYEAVNVWIFVILWPLLTVGMGAIILLQRRKIHRFRGQAG